MVKVSIGCRCAATCVAALAVFHSFHHITSRRSPRSDSNTRLAQGFEPGLQKPIVSNLSLRNPASPESKNEASEEYPTVTRLVRREHILPSWSPHQLPFKPGVRVASKLKRGRWLDLPLFAEIPRAGGQGPRFEGLENVSTRLVLGYLYIRTCFISFRGFHVPAAGHQPIGPWSSAVNDIPMVSCRCDERSSQRPDTRR
ncbi:hypothetical protein N658DRAFT_299340 [Parathielavia hyrcaniae]|uniref:Uncharacterized protein n=1 Tax=Parathielavia hyrcaniae TaxID=113614 RepID=A0AAN6Q994_9PEZI|nr:hypothetical protein N658DRAFT_299340 [Parathielavia hyrcaniae]